MQKLASEALAPAMRRTLGRVATYPFTGSAVLLALFLLSLTTDVAGRFGLIPFALVFAFHLRRVRGRGSS